MIRVYASARKGRVRSLSLFVIVSALMLCSACGTDSTSNALLLPIWVGGAQALASTQIPPVAPDFRASRFVTTPSKSLPKNPNNVPVKTSADLDPSSIAKQAFKSTVIIIADGNNGAAQGSGFVIQKGFVVTNYHVVDGSHKAVVRLVGQDITYPVQCIYALDQRGDLAILYCPSLNVFSGANGRIIPGEME